jgi:Ca2+-binding RTX toxin-like protein
MDGSTNASENGLHTISFDGIKQIKLTDASLSTTHDLSNSGDQLTFGSSGNSPINLSAGNNVLYAGAGDKTITMGDGNDVIIGDSGKQVFNLGAGDDTFVAYDANLKAAGTDYTVHGGAGSDTIDLGNIKGDWTLSITGSSASTQTYSSLDGGVLNIGSSASGASGTINYNGQKIIFDDIQKIVY